jgi:hypothetical protein
MNYRQHLILLIETFASARGLSPSRVSTVALNAGHTYQNLLDGKDITVGRFERAMRWFSENWPEDAEWPADVPRPTAEAA